MRACPRLTSYPPPLGRTAAGPLASQAGLQLTISPLHPATLRSSTPHSSRTGEMIGWSGRLKAAKDLYNLNAFITQEVALILAPNLFSAA